MVSRSADPTQGRAAAVPRRRSDRATTGERVATFVPSSSLAPSALAFAQRCHAGQRRESDGAPFIEHPLEVARLLRDAGCAEILVAAGLLHEVVEDADVSVAELTARFGADIAELVQAVTDDACVESYRQRKLVLREQVRRAGRDAALLFAADKIAEVRELPDQARRDRARFGATRANRARNRLEQHEQMRLEHYRESLEMLHRVAPRHPLVERLANELDAWPTTTAYVQDEVGGLGRR